MNTSSDNFNNLKRPPPRGVLRINDKNYSVFDGVNTVGRNKAAIINIKDLGVSQHHGIIIVLSEKEHYFSDLKSSNGSFINNQPTTALKLYQLHNGVDIRIGSVKGHYTKVADNQPLGDLNSADESQMCTQNFYKCQTQQMPYSDEPTSGPSTATKPITRSTTISDGGNFITTQQLENAAIEMESIVSEFQGPQTDDHDFNYSDMIAGGAEDNFHEIVHLGNASQTTKLPEPNSTDLVEAPPLPTAEDSQETQLLEPRNLDDSAESLALREAETQILPEVLAMREAETQILPEILALREVETQILPEVPALRKVETQILPEVLELCQAETQLLPGQSNFRDSISNEEPIIGGNTQDLLESFTRDEFLEDNMNDVSTAGVSVLNETDLSTRRSTGKADEIEETILEGDNVDDCDSNDSTVFVPSGGGAETLPHLTQTVDGGTQDSDSILHTSQLARRAKTRLESEDLSSTYEPSAELELAEKGSTKNNVKSEQHSESDTDIEDYNEAGTVKQAMVLSDDDEIIRVRKSRCRRLNSTQDSDDFNLPPQPITSKVDESEREENVSDRNLVKLLEEAKHIGQPEQEDLTAPIPNEPQQITKDKQSQNGASSKNVEDDDSDTDIEENADQIDKFLKTATDSFSEKYSRKDHVETLSVGKIDLDKITETDKFKTQRQDLNKNKRESSRKSADVSAADKSKEFELEELNESDIIPATQPEVPKNASVNTFESTEESFRFGLTQMLNEGEDAVSNNKIESSTSKETVDTTWQGPKAAESIPSQEKFDIHEAQKTTPRKTEAPAKKFNFKKLNDKKSITKIEFFELPKSNQINNLAEEVQKTASMAEKSWVVKEAQGGALGAEKTRQMTQEAQKNALMIAEVQKTSSVTEEAMEATSVTREAPKSVPEVEESDIYLMSTQKNTQSEDILISNQKNIESEVCKHNTQAQKTALAVEKVLKTVSVVEAHKIAPVAEIAQKNASVEEDSDVYLVATQKTTQSADVIRTRQATGLDFASHGHIQNREGRKTASVVEEAHKIVPVAEDYKTVSRVDDSDVYLVSTQKNVQNISRTKQSTASEDFGDIYMQNTQKAADNKSFGTSNKEFNFIKPIVKEGHGKKVENKKETCGKQQIGLTNEFGANTLDDESDVYLAATQKNFDDGDIYEAATQSADIYAASTQKENDANQDQDECLLLTTQNEDIYLASTQRNTELPEVPEEEIYLAATQRNDESDVFAAPAEVSRKKPRRKLVDDSNVYDEAIQANSVELNDEVDIFEAPTQRSNSTENLRQLEVEKMGPGVETQIEAMFASQNTSKGEVLQKIPRCKLVDNQNVYDETTQPNCGELDAANNEVDIFEAPTQRSNSKEDVRLLDEEKVRPGVETQMEALFASQSTSERVKRPKGFEIAQSPVESQLEVFFSSQQVTVQEDTNRPRNPLVNVLEGQNSQVDEISSFTKEVSTTAATTTRKTTMSTIDVEVATEARQDKQPEAMSSKEPKTSRGRRQIGRVSSSSATATSKNPSCSSKQADIMSRTTEETSTRARRTRRISSFSTDLTSKKPSSSEQADIGSQTTEENTTRTRRTRRVSSSSTDSTSKKLSSSEQADIGTLITEETTAKTKRTRKNSSSNPDITLKPSSYKMGDVVPPQTTEKTTTNTRRTRRVSPSSADSISKERSSAKQADILPQIIEETSTKTRRTRKVSSSSVDSTSSQTGRKSKSKQRKILSDEEMNQVIKIQEQLTSVAEDESTNRTRRTKCEGVSKRSSEKNDANKSSVITKSDGAQVTTRSSRKQDDKEICFKLGEVENTVKINKRNDGVGGVSICTKLDEATERDASIGSNESTSWKFGKAAKENKGNDDASSHPSKNYSERNSIKSFDPETLKNKRNDDSRSKSESASTKSDQARKSAKGSGDSSSKSNEVSMAKKSKESDASSEDVSTKLDKLRETAKRRNINYNKNASEPASLKSGDIAEAKRSKRNKAGVEEVEVPGKKLRSSRNMASEATTSKSEDSSEPELSSKGKLSNRTLRGKSEDIEVVATPVGKLAKKSVVSSEVNVHKAQFQEEFRKPPPTVVETRRRVRNLGRESSTESNSSDLTATPPKRGKISSTDSSPCPTPERQKRMQKPKVVFTMMNDAGLESLVRQLGGSVVDTVEVSTVLITLAIKRSQKLLTAVALGKPICSPKWLEACKKAHTFLDPWDHLINDQEAETKWNFSIRESLGRSQVAKLFKDYTFQIMVTNAADVLKGAIVACGGKLVTKIPANVDRFVVVSSIENKAKNTKLLKQNPELLIVESEAILDGVLRQEMRFHLHQIK